MTTLHKITFESRNFLFEAYGASSAAAHENLIEGLKEHARQAQIAEDWFREYEDDFNVETIDLSRPACMRDRYNLLKGCKATPKAAPVEPAGEQSYECKPAMLPVGFYWYFETDRQPVVVEKREPEDFVRFTNGRHQTWIRNGERFVGPISPVVGLERQMRELAQLGRAMLGWIDAVPADVELPAMPGFDRDWAESILQSAPEPDNPPCSPTSAQREVFTGYITLDGHRVQVDFDVPVGANMQTKDAAFLAALGQVAELDYVSMGVMDAPAAKPGKRRPSL